MSGLRFRRLCLDRPNSGLLQYLYTIVFSRTFLDFVRCSFQLEPANRIVDFTHHTCVKSYSGLSAGREARGGTCGERTGLDGGDSPRRATPAPAPATAYFAYNALNNTETLHIFRIVVWFICNSVLFTALYAMYVTCEEGPLPPAPRDPRIMVTLNPWY